MKFAHFLKDESGVTAIEYGLIAAAMGVMLIIAMPSVASGLRAVFGKLGQHLSTATGWTQ